MMLNRLFFLILLLPLQVWGFAGEIRFVQGDVRIQQGDGKIETAKRGSKVAEGDIIITGASGYAQLTMVDEAVIAVRPDTRLKVEIYRYDGKEGGGERSLLGLLRGGFRTITGWIGRNNKDAYTVKTPTATIGIRGTDHEPLYVPPPGPGEKALGEPGTYDKVNSGATVIQTGSGRIELGPNQVGFASATPGAVPVRLPQIPSFMRSTPTVRPDSGLKSSEQSSEQTTTSQQAASSSQPSSSTSASSSTGTTTDTVAGSLSTTPSQPLAPLPQSGTLDPRYTTSSTSYPAPTGFVAAGGDLSPGSGLGNGAGFVGNPVEGMAILLDSSGNPLTVATNGGFNFDRSGAPLIDSGAATVGTMKVNWGIYSGGVISDHQGTRYPQYFFFMGGGDATTPANLQAALPSPGSSLSFGTVGGYTKPITESGNVGGSVNSIFVELKNLSSVIVVNQYSIGLVDALGRSWSASMASPQPLANFVAGGGGGDNLTVTSCTPCAQPSGTGSARGMVIGNPIPAGFISSYTLKAGTAGVAGAVLAR